MRSILSLTLLLAAVSAQAANLDGNVRTTAGQPLPHMNVTATILPIDDAEDITASATSDESGHFHFENLRPGKYNVAATSDTVCGGATTVDLTAENIAPAAIVAATNCRKISGRVTGGKGAHVIAGHFHDNQTDLYAIALHGDRYAVVIADGGTIVVQAIAPQASSIETPIRGNDDATRDLFLEHRYAAMPAEAQKWVAKQAIPLKTVVAGNGFDDMKPIRDLVGPARIVALGEATHGTREFFQFKHRMLEFLVSQMGFNLFAIEASEPDAIAVDDYVLTGKGDPATALKNLGFWTWNTEEVLEMIRWMRAWNEDPAHERKVRFYGFDMQNPAAARTRLKDWLTTKAPAALPLLEKTAPLDRLGPKKLTADDKKNISEAIAALASSVDGVTPHDPAWQTARHFVDLLQQGLSMMTSDETSSVRDGAMADNIRWILDHESTQSKMVVWAHNGHVSAEELPFAVGGTMGVHLRKMFGKKLVVIGFAFNRGSFRAVDIKKGLIEQKAEPLDVNAFDRGLASAGPPLFILDLRKATGATRAWLAAPLPMRSIGAVYNEAKPKSYVGRIHPLESFDAVFFVNETTAAKQVRTPMPKPAAAAVNLTLDDGINGWSLSPPSRDAGYVVRAATDGCFHGGCAVMSRTGEKKHDGFGSFAQRIDATPYRGKKIHFRARMKSALTGDASSARIWLRVDRPDGMGFFDNMASRAPQSLPDWTDLEIVGDVAADAEAIAFGELFVGEGEAWIDESTLEVVP
jgi:erythromycin esterase